MDKLDCERAAALIDAAVDGELDLLARIAFDDHLAGCPACTAAYRARRQLVDRLRAEGERFAAPAALAGRILAALPAEAHPRRRRWGAPAALAGGLTALAASLGLFLAGPAMQDLETRDLVAAHIRSLFPDHLIDIPSSDRHTVKPWFNGRVALSPPVPDLPGYSLVGGRLDFVEDHPAAVVVYRRNQHVINLFAWSETGTPGPRLKSRDGYHLLEWGEGGIRYAAVSDLAPADLETFQRLWSAAARAAEGGAGEGPPR